jgi:hypothetical protein
VLNAIYEQDFLGFSYGFRPGRSQHQALDALAVGIGSRRVNWVLDADIRDFFDSLDRTELKKLIQIRVADGSLLRLIGKCLHVGVLDGADCTEPEKGTIQGSGLSPLLGNICLHYVLDLWFEQEVKPAPVRQSNADSVCDSGEGSEGEIPRSYATAPFLHRPMEAQLVRQTEVAPSRPLYSATSSGRRLLIGTSTRWSETRNSTLPMPQSSAAFPDDRRPSSYSLAAPSPTGLDGTQDRAAKEGWGRAAVSLAGAAIDGAAIDGATIDGAGIDDGNGLPSGTGHPLAVHVVDERGGVRQIAGP